MKRNSNETLFSRAQEDARDRKRDEPTARAKMLAPRCYASDFKRMLMIANDSGEMAVVVESNGILYEAIIDPLS